MLYIQHYAIHNKVSQFYLSIYKNVEKKEKCVNYWRKWQLFPKEVSASCVAVQHSSGLLGPLTLGSSKEMQEDVHNGCLCLVQGTQVHAQWICNGSVTWQQQMRHHHLHVSKPNLLPLKSLELGKGKSHSCGGNMRSINYKLHYGITSS